MLFVVLVAEAFVVGEVSDPVVFVDSVEVFDLVVACCLVVVFVVDVVLAVVYFLVEAFDLVFAPVEVCYPGGVGVGPGVVCFLVEVSVPVFVLVDVVGVVVSVPVFVVACCLGLVFVRAVLHLD